MSEIKYMRFYSADIEFNTEKAVAALRELDTASEYDNKTDLDALAEILADHGIEDVKVSAPSETFTLNAATGTLWVNRTKMIALLRALLPAFVDPGTIVIAQAKDGKFTTENLYWQQFYLNHAGLIPNLLPGDQIPAVPDLWPGFVNSSDEMHEVERGLVTHVSGPDLDSDLVLNNAEPGYLTVEQAQGFITALQASTTAVIKSNKRKETDRLLNRLKVARADKQHFLADNCGSERKQTPAYRQALAAHDAAIAAAAEDYLIAL